MTALDVQSKVLTLLSVSPDLSTDLCVSFIRYYSEEQGGVGVSTIYEMVLEHVQSTAKAYQVRSAALGLRNGR